MKHALAVCAAAAVAAAVIVSSVAMTMRAQDIHRDNYRRCLVELHHAADLASKNTEVNLWRLPECLER